MIHCVFPRAGDTGWGVVGRSLTRALVRRSGARLVASSFHPAEGSDPLVDQELLLHRTDREALLASGGSVPWPTLQAIRNTGFCPLEPAIRGTRRLGYTFFEKDRLSDLELRNLREHFDAVLAGSSWCAQTLQRHGVANVSGQGKCARDLGRRRHPRSLRGDPIGWNIRPRTLAFDVQGVWNRIHSGG